jgi:hypothetical protein
MPAGKWAMGRVLDLHPGRDGQVRVVSLKTQSNILKRPVIKLVPLLPDEQSEQRDQSASTPNIKTTSSRRRSEISGPKNIKNFFLSFFVFVSFLFSPSLQQTQQYNVSSINNNQSIYFDKLSGLHYIRDEWNIVVFYNMSTYWLTLQNINNYVIHKKNSCPADNTQCQSVILQLDHELDEINNYNQLFTNYHTKRQKRGLVNGVGYIANSLFGVLDQRFADQYQKDRMY